MRRRREPPTQARVKELVAYDPETGIFTRRVKTSRFAVGSRSGYLKQSGYRVISIDGRQFEEHRLAWLYVHGEWPADEIDHKNCDPSDNRLSNLRTCSLSQNRANFKRPRSNKSGYKGVCWSKSNKGWCAQIKVNKQRYYLGTFETPERAHAAYVEAARLHFGEFARAA